jgi:hypothetical protein
MRSGKVNWMLGRRRRHAGGALHGGADPMQGPAAGSAKFGNLERRLRVVWGMDKRGLSLSERQKWTAAILVLSGLALCMVLLRQFETMDFGWGSLAAVVVFFILAANAESVPLGVLSNIVLSLLLLGSFRGCIGPEFARWPVVVFSVALLVALPPEKQASTRRPATAVAAAAFGLYLQPVHDYIWLAATPFNLQLSAIAAAISASAFFPLANRSCLLRSTWSILEPGVLICLLWLAACPYVKHGNGQEWLVYHLIPNMAAPTTLAAGVIALRHLVAKHLWIRQTTSTRDCPS